MGEEYNCYEPILGSDLSEIDQGRALALLHGYCDQWRDYDAEVIDAEVEFEVSLPGTDWTLVGKIDLLCRDDRGLVLVEHKTKTGDVHKTYDPYYQKLSFDAQISIYHLAQYALIPAKDDHGTLPQPVSRTIYDVIRKITTKPKAIPKGSEGATGTRSEIEAHGTYYGFKVSDKADRELTKEDIDLYSKRLCSEVSNDPEKYFHQYSLICRSRTQIKETARQLIQITRDIDRAKSEGAWYQNTSNCNAYGTTCEYFDLCLGVSNPLNEEKWRPRKGSDLSGDNRLSHSRATCFHSCRRKYYWRYVEKIEPVKPESQALRFGSVFHKALEFFWKRRKECQKQK